MNARHASLQVLQAILQQGRNLDNALERVMSELDRPQDQALVQHLCYGVMRWYPQLEFLLAQLLAKPLKAKDGDLRLLLLLGLYQLRYSRIPDHAAVSESVTLAQQLNKGWAKGLVNAVLRNYTRRQAELERLLQQDPVASSAHPAWLLKLLQQAWPQHWPQVIEANNQQAPLTLRVNQRQLDRDAYLAQLQQQGLPAHPAPHAPQGITLAEACPVSALPGFESGRVSVQDAAAQLAATLLAPRAGERVLDACAAPGGKTAHLLESQPELDELLALDLDAQRLSRISDTLQRLGLSARLQQGDASRPADWWDGRPFDRILLDAPCSATGVIRRHPDIKQLRRAGDIPALVKQQAQMLDALWPLLKPGGMLLYATCSVLPEENSRQIAAFMQRQSDARQLPLSVAWGRDMEPGRQILPGEDEMDGFYYACLGKTG